MNETPEAPFPSSAHCRDKPPGRIGSCVGTFLQLFDWNPRKRLFSNKRLPAERRKTSKKKFKDERMPVAKLLLLADEESRSGYSSPKRSQSSAPDSENSKDSVDDGGNKRVPGVVARLMGLESLPEYSDANVGNESPQHPRKPPMEIRPLQELLHVRAEPVLLQDLLRDKEYLDAKRGPFKERLPGFVKKFPSETGRYEGSFPTAREMFSKPIKTEPLQPYVDHKFQKNLRPLKKSMKDASEGKHLLLALSPRASTEGLQGLRPILLPSKTHNKLISSPIKSPTKLGSKSAARLLEAAVKILEPSLQVGNVRSRAPPSRHYMGFAGKDLESEQVKNEEKKEKVQVVDKRVVSSSIPPPPNAGKGLKGPNMNRSWNGKDESVRNYQDSKNSAGLSESTKKRFDQAFYPPPSRSMPTPKISQRSRATARGASYHEEVCRSEEESRARTPCTGPEGDVCKVEEVIKTVIPQGFEGALEGGLRPLNTGRRDDFRHDTQTALDSRSERLVRRALEKHIAPASQCQTVHVDSHQESAPIALPDPLRRSGSAKEGPSPAPPTVSRSRFLRSKSVKEEKQAKGHVTPGAQGSLHSKGHKDEIKLEPHSAVEAPDASLDRTRQQDAVVAERDTGTEAGGGFRAMKAFRGKAAAVAKQDRDAGIQGSKVFPSENQATDEASKNSPSCASSSRKDPKNSGRSNAGGLLSYSRLFGSRRAGEKTENSEDSASARSEVQQKKNDSSLVRSLLRRKTSISRTFSSGLGVETKKKSKSQGSDSSNSRQSSPGRDISTVDSVPDEYRGELDDPELNDIDKPAKTVLLLEKASVVERDSPPKSVDDVFPQVPLGKNCLKSKFSESIAIDGSDSQCGSTATMGSKKKDAYAGVDRARSGRCGKSRPFPASLLDDLKLDDVFFSDTVAMQASGKGGFSYSPLVELEEFPRTSMESFTLDGRQSVDGRHSLDGRLSIDGYDTEKRPSFSGRSNAFAMLEISLARQEANLDSHLQEKTRSEQRLKSFFTMLHDSDIITEPGRHQDIIVGIQAPKSGTNEKGEKVGNVAVAESTPKSSLTGGRVILAQLDPNEAKSINTGSEDCGQPSPVSVLDSPFLEESPIAQDLHSNGCDTHGLHLRKDTLVDSFSKVSPELLQSRNNARTIEDQYVASLDISSTCHEKTQSEKIMGAILDISRIRCIDPSAIGLIVDSSPAFRDEEEEYVSKILSVWESSKELPEIRTSGNLPMASTLFDRLESQERAFAWRKEMEREQFESPQDTPSTNLKRWQGLWLHRRLLFDCVNEALTFKLKPSHPDPWIVRPNLRPQSKGRDLVTTVYREIQASRELGTEDLDTIVGKDMCRGAGMWTGYVEEISEIGLDIEKMILRVLIDEVVSEIAQVHRSRHSRANCQRPLQSSKEMHFNVHHLELW